jgi:predicted nuclease of predicted toxin-antitoxin system
VIKFLIDEDMPRSTKGVLEAAGYEALDSRDCGLRGKNDRQIFDFAQQSAAIILTGDVGFGNIYQFPLGTHHGIIVAHFPNELSTSEINGQITKALENLTEEDFTGNLIILEPGRIRIRKKRT